MTAMSVACRTLLSSSNFYHINLTYHQSAKRLVQQLVQLDRLPKENSLEGLLLLRSAWRDYDVAMLLAGRYKRVCKVTFVLQLLLGWLAVAMSTMSENLTGADPIFNATLFGVEEGASGAFVHLIFAASVAMTFTIAFDSILVSSSRWRQLRIGAAALESVVWKYRTRTGPFEVEESGQSRDSAAPEAALLRAVRTTRTNMLQSANLTTSEFSKRYPLRIYKHYQDRGRPKRNPGPLAVDAEARHTKDEPIDDHQSPTQPMKYIALRVEPAIAFYQRRIPKYARRAAALRLVIVGLGIGASVLARYEFTLYVVMVTSLAAAVTSWQEFSDTQRKTERYTRAVTQLRDLLDWWRSLSEVEKASKSMINMLVNGTESIINSEQTAWTSTPQSEKAESDNTDSDEGGGDAKAGKAGPKKS